MSIYTLFKALNRFQNTARTKSFIPITPIFSKNLDFPGLLHYESTCSAEYIPIFLLRICKFIYFSDTSRTMNSFLLPFISSFLMQKCIFKKKCFFLLLFRKFSHWKNAFLKCVLFYGGIFHI